MIVASTNSGMSNSVKLAEIENYLFGMISLVQCKYKFLPFAVNKSRNVSSGDSLSAEGKAAIPVKFKSEPISMKVFMLAVLGQDTH